MKVFVHAPGKCFKQLFRWCLAFCCWLIGLSARANVSPADGSVLTQIHIMFECDDVYGADRYEISIYQLPDDNKTTGEKRVLTVTMKGLATPVTDSLQFGAQYRWQFRAFRQQTLVFTSPSYRFRILESAQVSDACFRTEVTSVQEPGKEIIFLDHSAIAINKQGKPVWFLPVNTDSLNQLVIRDLKLTPDGNITHVDLTGAYEQQLNGTVRWKAPDNGNVSGGHREDYHHQLNKLEDGSYVVVGSMYKPGEEPAANFVGASGIRYNTLIHYNRDGTVRNSWSELNSLQVDPLFQRFLSNNSGAHLNGFARIPGTNKYYVSFKNLSDVFVLDMNTGRFESCLKQNSAGSKIQFYQQHGPFVSPGGDMLLYNNNIVDKEDDSEIRHPSVLVFRYNAAAKQFRQVWDYEVHADKYPGGILGKEGYASTTPQGNILVCAGGANYAAEISHDKQKLWECYFYKKQKQDSLWTPYSNYRCQAFSSLYPLYVTLQYAGQQQGLPQFRITNNGSEAHQFELAFSNNNPGKKTRSMSHLLQPGESQLVTPGKGFERLFNIRCRITCPLINDFKKDYFYNILNQPK